MGEKTKTMIAAAYGDGEAFRFLNDSGYTFLSGRPPKGPLRNWIDGRMRRINELLPRVDTLTVRKDFDPKQFD